MSKYLLNTDIAVNKYITLFQNMKSAMAVVCSKSNTCLSLWMTGIQVTWFC